MAVATRLRDAMNAHDLEALIDCFHEDYRSEQPAHPGRGFGGREQVRSNWTAIFGAMPDFRAELLTHGQDDVQEWAEWRWTGTRGDARALDMAGARWRPAGETSARAALAPVCFGCLNRKRRRAVYPC